MANGNMTRRNIQYHLRNKKRIIPGYAITLGKIPHFFLECIDSSDTTGEDNAYPVVVYIIFCNTGICHSLVADSQGGLCKPVQLTGFFFVKITERIKIL